MKLCILGTNYNIEHSTHDDDARLIDCDGYTDISTKTLCIESNMGENDPNSISDFSELKKRVKRHEIIHAFFFESGLTDCYKNEQLVEWIAVQFPKILEVFQKAGCS